MLPSSLDHHHRHGRFMLAGDCIMENSASGRHPGHNGITGSTQKHGHGSLLRHRRFYDDHAMNEPTPGAERPSPDNRSSDGQEMPEWIIGALAGYMAAVASGTLTFLALIAIRLQMDEPVARVHALPLIERITAWLGIAFISMLYGMSTAAFVAAVPFTALLAIMRLSRATNPAWFAMAGMACAQAVPWTVLGEFHVTAPVTASGCIGGLAFHRVAIRLWQPNQKQARRWE